MSGTTADAGNRVLASQIGLGLSMGLWLLSSWRLIFHILVKRRQMDDSTTGSEPVSQTFTQWFTRRRTFHCLLWFATCCEALAYADTSGVLMVSKDRVFAEKLGYVLLDVAGRSILEMLAFCTVTAIWLRTAIESSPSVLWGSRRTPFGILPTLFLVLILLLVLASATLSVIALVLYQNDTLDDIEKLSFGRAQILLEAIAWGVHALVVLECLIVTSKRVLNLVPNCQWRQRVLLLRKAVLPMFVAAFAYTLRCLWLAAILWKVPFFARGTWAWWIGFAWTPTWLAVGFLLYSARKRDSNSDELQQPLLLPARPPAEAFLAFSQHRQLLDVDDSFSFCRSPITRIAATHDDLEEGETSSIGSRGAENS